MRFFSELSNAFIRQEISEWFDQVSLSRFAQINRRSYVLFKTRLAVSHLLQHVVRGEQDQAEIILQNNSDLLFQKGKVTDCSGRTFINISPLQYTFWALDTHMWKMMLSIVKNKNIVVLEQLNELEVNGTEHGKHYDFTLLINALHKYVINYALWDSEQRRENWGNVIGRIQRTLPAHVIQEYCYPNRPFYPCPLFKEKIFPRTFNLGFSEELVWRFPNDSFYFAYCKDRKEWVGGCCEPGGAVAYGGISSDVAVNMDLVAIKKLYEVRAVELEELKEHLMFSLFSVSSNFKCKIS